MSSVRNMTDVINKAKQNFVDDYVRLGMKRQPSTKPRDEEQRNNMLVIDAEIIRKRVDISKFKPAPEEVVNAYVKRN